MRGPAATLAAAGVTLILTGIGVAGLPGLLRDDDALRAPAREIPVNAGAGDRSIIDAHNSPTLARNPRDGAHLAVSSRIDTPEFSCALHVSFDGGRRWRPTAVPVPEGEERKCYAPDVVFAADGTLHLSYVTLRGVGNVPHRVWTASSRDGGRTLGTPRRVSGPRAFQVRLAADPADARRLYVTWLQAREVGPLRFTTTGNPVVAARSRDGGRTWRRPVRVSDPERERVLAPTPAVGADGEVYVLHVDVGEDRLDYHGGHDGFGGPPHPGPFTLVLGRSQDGGATWAQSVVADDVRPVARFIPFLPAFPALAVDRRSGRVHVGYHDRRRGDADVLVWTLDRGAEGWRGPVRVNERTRGAQYLPQLAVAGDGRLDAVYFDRGADASNVRNEVVLRSSRDGARSFGPRVALSTRAFDARIGFGSERGMPDLGSRLGLVSGDDRATAVWPDTRSGTDASNKQDLMLAVAGGRPSGDGLARDGGLALAAGGVVALVLAARRRRS